MTSVHANRDGHCIECGGPLNVLPQGNTCIECGLVNDRTWAQSIARIETFVLGGHAGTGRSGGTGVMRGGQFCYPENPFHHGSQIGPGLFTGTDARDAGRLKDVDFKVKRDPLAPYLEAIMFACTLVHVPGVTRDRAVYIFRRTAKAWRNEKMATGAACIYIAAREHGIPLRVRDIADAFSLRQRNHHGSHAFMMRRARSIATVVPVHPRPARPSDHVPRIMANLEREPRVACVASCMHMTVPAFTGELGARVRARLATPAFARSGLTPSNLAALATWLEANAITEARAGKHLVTQELACRAACISRHHLHDLLHKLRTRRGALQNHDNQHA